MKRNLKFLAMRLLLVAAMFGYCAQAQAQSEKKPYAWISDYATRLTFYYTQQGQMQYLWEVKQQEAKAAGEQDEETLAAIVGKYYEMPTNSFYEQPWTGSTTITKATFDESFKEFTALKSTAYMFAGMTNLATIEHLDYLNTSSVDGMACMFDGCQQLTILDLTGFDVTNLSVTMNMFQNCLNLTTIYCNDTWTVESSDVMFDGCKKLTGAIAYEELDEPSNLTADYANPVSGFFTAKGTQPYALFFNDLLTIYNDDQKTQRIREFYQDFSGMTIDCFDLRGWDGTEQPAWAGREYISIIDIDASFASYDALKSTNRMFANMVNLTAVNGLSNLNTANVTDMYGMFYQCSSLLELDLNGFNVSNVTNMICMFFGCTSLTTIYCDDTWTCEESNNMFTSCSEKLVGAVKFSHENDNDVKYANPNDGYFTSRTAYAVFSDDDETLTFYYDNQRNQREGTEGTTYSLSDEMTTPGWISDGSYVYITTAKFDPSFADARPKSTPWFMRCSWLKTITGMEYLNTSEVTYMWSMFYGCSSLTDIDLSHFDTSKVLTADYMFTGCKELETLDLSTFNLSNASMTGMFKNCTKLATIYCDNTWQSNASKEMFSWCTKLVGAISYDPDKLDVAYANPNNGYFTHKNATGGVIDVLLTGSVGTARVEYDPYDADNNALGNTFLSTEDGQYTLRHDVMKAESWAYLNVYPPTSGTWTVSRDGTDITEQFEKDEVNGNFYMRINAADLRTSTYVVRVEAAASGDINGDGSITIADVTKLVNIILGKE